MLAHSNGDNGASRTLGSVVPSAYLGAFGSVDWMPIHLPGSNNKITMAMMRVMTSIRFRAYHILSHRCIGVSRKKKMLILINFYSLFGHLIQRRMVQVYFRYVHIYVYS